MPSLLAHTLGGVLFLFLSVFLLTDAHECIHEQLPDLIESIPHELDVESMRRSIAQGNAFSQPMRILLNYDNIQNDPHTCYSVGQSVTYGPGQPSHSCTADDVVSSGKNSFLQSILAEAEKFYEHTLTTYPLAQLNIPTSVCTSLKAPASYSALTGYDFVIMVTARAIQSETVLATGTTCITESQGGVSGRPTVGWINFAPSQLIVDEKLERDKQIGVAIHEIAHSLGFSSNFLLNRGFIRWNSPTTYENLPPEQITATLSSRVYVVTPRVKQEAIAHFGCSSLPGAELESSGGSGTAGAHWIKKYYMNEYMTGSASDFPLYSQFTFALFEDTGFYGILDRSRIQTLVFGRGRGCNFPADCLQWPATSDADPGYRCQADTTGLSADECAFDLRAKGFCSAGRLQGGLIDPCSLIISGIETRCDNPYDSGVGLDVGERKGVNSRCFQSNILQISDQFVGEGGTTGTHCYETTCSAKSELKVAVPDRFKGVVWYDCPYAGGSISPLYYGGKITCINKAADRVCLDAPTDNTWPEFTSISPAAGKAETAVVIKGKNFQRADKIRVFIHAECLNVVVSDDTTIRCTLPASDQFAHLKIVGDVIADGTSALPIIIRDERSGENLMRTAHKENAFTLEMDGGEAIGLFAQTQPGWFAAIIIAIVLVILLLVLCVVKCCCARDKEGKRKPPMYMLRRRGQ